MQTGFAKHRKQAKTACFVFVPANIGRHAAGKLPAPRAQCPVIATANGVTVAGASYRLNAYALKPFLAGQHVALAPATPGVRHPAFRKWWSLSYAGAACGRQPTLFYTIELNSVLLWQPCIPRHQRTALSCADVINGTHININAMQTHNIRPLQQFMACIQP